MRVNDDYKECNVAVQVNDPTSVLSFWKRALQIRKVHDVLVSRSFTRSLFVLNQDFSS